MLAKVLIIDDEELFREDLADLLRRRHYECTTAACGEDGIELVQKDKPDIVLCDLVMPGKDGIEVLETITQISPETFVIMITAFGNLDTAISAFRKGATDYVIKPLVIEDVVQKFERLMESRHLMQEVNRLRRDANKEVSSLPMLGKSDAMTEVFQLIGRVASTRTSVLITGESGTGKELVARAIHTMSESGDGTWENSSNGQPFVAINCAGIPAELMESELFGYRRGAFTGAVKDRVGHFELARNGSILLDEIAEMPLTLQSKLLRVLDQREITPIGGTEPIGFSARIIAATNKNLRDQVEIGQFREDLYFRLAVLEIAIPPLRERMSDIPLLTDHFIEMFNADMKRKCLGVESSAMNALLSHSWPGNIRELRNVLERAMILCSTDYISLIDLPQEFYESDSDLSNSDDLRTYMRKAEAQHIKKILVGTKGNKEEAARCMKINPSTLYRKMSNLGIAHEYPTNPM